MLLGGFPMLALTILLYGGGYGIMWIARGTLPLALFGAGALRHADGAARVSER